MGHSELQSFRRFLPFMVNLLREGNVFTSVCHSVHRRGVPPPEATESPPPTHPGIEIWWRPPKRAVRILLECILVHFFFWFHLVIKRSITRYDSIYSTCPCFIAGKEYLFVADWGDDCIKCFLPENGIMRKLIRIPGVSTICVWDIH